MTKDVNNNSIDESLPNELPPTYDDVEDASEPSCSSITNTVGNVNHSFATDEEEITVDEESVSEVQVVRVRHVEDDIGCTNLGYSIQVLPVLADLDEQCRHRYSVVLDNFDSSDEDQDYTEALSTVIVHRTCSCNCHRTVQTLPSYDSVMMGTIQHSDTVVHDDINCNGVTCNSTPTYRTHSRNLLQIPNSTRSSPNITPGNTPGRTRRLASQVVKILNSASASPVLGREPPNYKSLIFAILKDEPPKYEEVTGKKLADELIPSTSSVSTRRTDGRPSIRQRLIRMGTCVIVALITIVLLYLSAEGLDTKRFSGSSSESRKSSKAISNATATP